MTTCPLDGAPLREENYGDVAHGACPSCFGIWVNGESSRALLDGSVVLPDDVLRLGGSLAQRLRTPAVPPDDADVLRERTRRRVVRCADCSTRMRVAEGGEVAACVRCGGLWIPSGDAGALVRWYRSALHLRSLAALQPTRIRYGQWRDVDEHGDFTRMLVVLVATFAFFVLVAPLENGTGRGGGRLRPMLLGLAGVGLVIHAFRHPSKVQPGALTRRGFGFALTGVALGVLAILDWN